MAHKLNDRQLKFCQNYLKDPNGKQAAIKAGYSPKTAESMASENLRKPKVKEYLDKHRLKAEKKADISAEWVAQQLKDIVQNCKDENPTASISGLKALQDQFGYKSIDKKEVDVKFTIFTGVPDIKREKK